MTKDNKSNSILIKFAFLAIIILCLFPFVNGPLALVLGFLYAHFIGHPFLQLNHKAVNWLLKIAIVGLGFGMNLDNTMKAGQEGFLLTAMTIVFTLVLGFIIGKLLKIHKKTTHLISSGTAICGGSAIAAVGAVINASEKNMSVSLGVVFLLNSIALLIFPAIGHSFNLTEHQFGMWSAISIHDTSSVVGAAYEYGDEALHVATTVKLARALWIIPISILSIFLFKGKGKKIKIPWFIFLFIGAILISTYLSMPAEIITSFTFISKRVLVVTLFLIGAGLSVENIKSAGWKPMILGMSLWIIISVLSLLIVLLH